MKVAIGLILCLTLVGCATIPEGFQPSLNESYGIIKPENGIYIENVDEKHMNFGIYGYKGDMRVSPGTHSIGLHYDSPGVFAHYTGSKLTLSVDVKEGKRYYIGADITRKLGFPVEWKPMVTKEEKIEGYSK